MSNFEKKNLKSLSKNSLIRIVIDFADKLQKQESRINELEQKIKSSEKDSSNSSKPPTTDNDNKPKKNQSLREKTNKKSGGQKGNNGNSKKMSKTPDKIVDCRPCACEDCGSSLRDTEGTVVDKRQEIDIPPIKLEITEYRLQSAICPNCQKGNLGKYPENISSNSQFGVNIKSFVTYLNIKHKVPFKRLTEIFEDMLNTKISEGSIENSLEQLKNKSLNLYQEILDTIKKERWTGSDETGIHVNGKKWWLWVWQNVKGSYYAATQSRGYKVVKEYFGENYWGILIHDCWSAHNNTIAKLGHQLCHPHLVRDLNYLIESYKNNWCYKMKELLLKSEKARDKIWTKNFNEQTRNAVITSYGKQLEILLTQNLSTEKEVATLQKRFRKHREKILYFMNFQDVPFHNNSSERAIRNAKIHKKVSGGFRSEAGAERHAILLSVIETCKKQDLNVLDSLKQIYSGTFSWKSA